MFFTIYKTTNITNNKFYIGKHITNDINDEYVGSGKLLKAAIKKHGLKNFKKEILFIFDNEKEMNQKEKELVTEIFVLEDSNYNLCVGGKGGWSFVNLHCGSQGERLNRALSKEQRDKGRKKARESFKKRIKTDSIAAEKHKEHMERFREAGKISFLGKKHSEETKKLIGEKNSLKQKGKNNSQFGTCWITNNKENKKIRKEDLPKWERLGFHKGRC